MKQKNKTSTGSGSRVLDVILVLAILASAVFVFSRLRSQSSDSSDPDSSSPLANKNLPTVAPTETTAIPAAMTWYDWLASFQFVTDEAWKKLESDPKIEKLKIAQTARCQEPTAPKLWSLLIDSPAAAQKFKEGQLRVAFDPHNRLCMSTGDQIEALVISKVPTDPILSHIGSVTIQSLITLTVHSWPEELIAALNLNPTNFSEHFARVAPEAKTLPLVRWSAPKLTPPSRPIPWVHNLAIPAKESDFARLVTAGAYFVDLRNEGSDKIASEKSYMHVPFKISGGGDNQFTFKRQAKEVYESEFDFDAILKTTQKNTPIIFVGSDASDGRPIWAAIHLRELGHNNIYFAEAGIAAVERYFGSQSR